MRLPVSMRAVAMMVSEPPSSMLRAAPKKRLGFCRALESTPPERILPRVRHHGVVGAGQAGDRVQQDHHVLAVLDQAPALGQHHVRPPARAARGLVEGRTDDLAVHRAGHVGHFLGPLVDEQHDQVHLGVILVIALAIFCRIIVLPARGGATIRPRCPLPIGESRFATGWIPSSWDREKVHLGRLTEPNL
jgi:hypothetical protein